MSQHRSLRGAGGAAAKKNVLKRRDRIKLLKQRGRGTDAAKFVGLPKTKPE
jgi:small basic protein (TIGR04137 family)